MTKKIPKQGTMGFTIYKEDIFRIVKSSQTKHILVDKSSGIFNVIRVYMHCLSGFLNCELHIGGRSYSSGMSIIHFKEDKDIKITFTWKPNKRLNMFNVVLYTTQ